MAFETQIVMCVRVLIQLSEGVADPWQALIGYSNVHRQQFEITETYSQIAEPLDSNNSSKFFRVFPPT